MKKIYAKLAVSALSIFGAIAMIISVSYAWLTISESPEINGIAVTISGGNTIKLAPDVVSTTVDEDGNEVVVHYPGVFDERLVFSQHEVYDYLKEVSALNPTSTADGIHWFLPSYDAETGNLLEAEKFEIDNTLEHGNVISSENGNYVYLDFWIVSPGFEYEVRVSTDDKTNDGSFLIELPAVEKKEDGGYTLADTDGIIESSARVGFLVNEEGNSDSMIAYMASDDYDSRYDKIKGVYQEKGKEASGISSFTIYEPNALSHPSTEISDGKYVTTKPLAYDKYTMEISEADIQERVMVQDNSTWRTLDSGIQLEQILQTAIAGKTDLTEDNIEDYFYSEYLQRQVGAYVKCGNFFTSTNALYEAASANRTQAALSDGSLTLAGATDDVTITCLERNTPQRIRMFIWLEGQDVDCTNSNSLEETGFALSIELSGATK